MYNTCKVKKLYMYFYMWYNYFVLIYFNISRIFLGELMDKNIYMTLLYDTYGKLLTKRQQEIFEEYYLYNLSLREIAENKGISYQGVRDSVKSSETLLNQFEDTLGLLNILQNNKKAYEICVNSKNLNDDKEKLIELLK